MKRNNFMIVSYEALAGLVGLPQGCTVEQVLSEDFDRTTKGIRLLVSGKMCQAVPEGCPVMVVTIADLCEKAKE